MLKYIFNRYKKKFIAYAFADAEAKQHMIEHVFNNQRKAPAFHDWQVAFIDSNSKKYYTTADVLKLPMERVNMLKHYYAMQAAGINDSELNKFITQFQQNLEDCINSAQLSGRIEHLGSQQALLTMLKERKSLAIHKDIFFHIAATVYVREDEQPDIVDSEIEKEKVAQFKKDSAGGLYDFFYRSELKKHLPYSNISEEEFTHYLAESAQKIEVDTRMLQFLVGRRSEQNEEKA